MVHRPGRGVSGFDPGRRGGRAVPFPERLRGRYDRPAGQLPRCDPSSLLHRIEAAGGASITIQFTDYNTATGELLFNANSSQVIDIPTYIRSLQSCGVFSTVSYTGYNADDDGYSIDLRCVLAAPQQ